MEFKKIRSVKSPLPEKRSACGWDLHRVEFEDGTCACVFTHHLSLLRLKDQIARKELKPEELKLFAEFQDAVERAYQEEMDSYGLDI